MTPDKYKTLRNEARAISNFQNGHPNQKVLVPGSEQEIYEKLVLVYESLLKAVIEENVKMNEGGAPLETCYRIQPLFKVFEVKYAFKELLPTPEWREFCLRDGMREAVDRMIGEKIAKNKGQSP